MTLQERIESDLKTALKEKDKPRLSALRLIKAAIKNKEIEKGSPLSDEDLIALLSSLAKQRKESIEEFRRGGREDLAHKEEEELRLLKSYLPEELSKEELTRLVKETITEVGATTAADMGKVMKALMPKVRGRADGKEVSGLVREILSASN
ncbi:MAG: GatB/YqeY domain-containing protein [Nitrospirae bacterium]|nr:MAG: GatB/YqeY domain-containing protein [Nitrospirota bacterium]